jgi:hypothetical protein
MEGINDNSSSDFVPRFYSLQSRTVELYIKVMNQPACKNVRELAGKKIESVFIRVLVWFHYHSPKVFTQAHDFTNSHWTFGNLFTNQKKSNPSLNEELTDLTEVSSQCGQKIPQAFKELVTHVKQLSEIAKGESLSALLTPVYEKINVTTVLNQCRKRICVTTTLLNDHFLNVSSVTDQCQPLLCSRTEQITRQMKIALETLDELKKLDSISASTLLKVQEKAQNTFCRLTSVHVGAISQALTTGNKKTARMKDLATHPLGVDTVIRQVAACAVYDILHSLDVAHTQLQQKEGENDLHRTFQIVRASLKDRIIRHLGEIGGDPDSALSPPIFAIRLTTFELFAPWLKTKQMPEAYNNLDSLLGAMTRRKLPGAAQFERHSDFSGEGQSGSFDKGANFVRKMAKNHPKELHALNEQTKLLGCLHKLKETGCTLLMTPPGEDDDYRQHLFAAHRRLGQAIERLETLSAANDPNVSRWRRVERQLAGLLTHRLNPKGLYKLWRTLCEERIQAATKDEGTLIAAMAADLTHTVWHCCALSMVVSRSPKEVQAILMPVNFALNKLLLATENGILTEENRELCQSAWDHLFCALDDLVVGKAKIPRQKAASVRHCLSIQYDLFSPSQGIPHPLKRALDQAFDALQQPPTLATPYLTAIHSRTIELCMKVMEEKKGKEPQKAFIAVIDWLHGAPHTVLQEAIRTLAGIQYSHKDELSEHVHQLARKDGAHQQEEPDRQTCIEQCLKRLDITFALLKKSEVDVSWLQEAKTNLRNEESDELRLLIGKHRGPTLEKIAGLPQPFDTFYCQVVVAVTGDLIHTLDALEAHAIHQLREELREILTAANGGLDSAFSLPLFILRHRTFELFAPFRGNEALDTAFRFLMRWFTQLSITACLKGPGIYQFAEGPETEDPVEFWRAFEILSDLCDKAQIETSHELQVLKKHVTLLTHLFKAHERSQIDLMEPLGTDDDIDKHIGAVGRRLDTALKSLKSLFPKDKIGITTLTRFQEQLEALKKSGFNTAELHGVFRLVNGRSLHTLLENLDRFKELKKMERMLLAFLTEDTTFDLIFHLWHCCALSMTHGRKPEDIYEFVFPVSLALRRAKARNQKTTELYRSTSNTLGQALFELETAHEAPPLERASAIRHCLSLSILGDSVFNDKIMGAVSTALQKFQPGPMAQRPAFVPRFYSLQSRLTELYIQLMTKPECTDLRDFGGKGIETAFIGALAWFHSHNAKIRERMPNSTQVDWKCKPVFEVSGFAYLPLDGEFAGLQAIKNDYKGKLPEAFQNLFALLSEWKALASSGTGGAGSLLLSDGNGRDARTQCTACLQRLATAITFIEDHLHQLSVIAKGAKWIKSASAPDICEASIKAHEGAVGPLKLAKKSLEKLLENKELTPKALAQLATVIKEEVAVPLQFTCQLIIVMLHAQVRTLKENGDADLADDPIDFLTVSQQIIAGTLHDLLHTLGAVDAHGLPQEEVREELREHLKMSNLGVDSAFSLPYFTLQQSTYNLFNPLLGTKGMELARQRVMSWFDDLIPTTGQLLPGKGQYQEATEKDAKLAIIAAAEFTKGMHFVTKLYEIPKNQSSKALQRLHKQVLLLARLQVLQDGGRLDLWTPLGKDTDIVKHLVSLRLRLTQSIKNLEKRFPKNKEAHVPLDQFKEELEWVLQQEVTAYQLRPLWKTLVEETFSAVLKNHTTYLHRGGKFPMEYTHLTVGSISDLNFHLWHCYALAMVRGNSSEALYDHVLPVYKAVEGFLKKNSKQKGLVSKILEKASSQLVGELGNLKDCPLASPYEKAATIRHCLSLEVALSAFEKKELAPIKQALAKTIESLSTPWLERGANFVTLLEAQLKEETSAVELKAGVDEIEGETLTTAETTVAEEGNE